MNWEVLSLPFLLGCSGSLGTLDTFFLEKRENMPIY